jgi:hypothetical protein
MQNLDQSLNQRKTRKLPISRHPQILQSMPLQMINRKHRVSSAFHLNGHRFSHEAHQTIHRAGCHSHCQRNIVKGSMTIWLAELLQMMQKTDLEATAARPTRSMNLRQMSTIATISVETEENAQKANPGKIQESTTERRVPIERTGGVVQGSQSERRVRVQSAACRMMQATRVCR